LTKPRLVDEAGLRQRYVDALQNLTNADYYDQSAVLGAPSPHFDADWINAQYPQVRNKGGRYWPAIPSDTVVQQIQTGTFIGIHKALGNQLRHVLAVDLQLQSVADLSLRTTSRHCSHPRSRVA
jgi:hypothetical protein